MTATIDLQPGQQARRFSSQEFREIQSVWPASVKRAAVVTFTDGTSTTIGREAEWEVKG